MLKDETRPRNRLSELFDAHKKDSLSDAAKEIMARTLPPHRYAMYIIGRSGSTYLNQEVRLRGGLGDPNEWFNPDSIDPRLGEFGISSARDYLEFICRYKSLDDVFGYQISWPHHRFVRELVDIEAFFEGSLKYFFLRRRNIVAQAISGIIASRTGYYHSYQGERSDFEAPALEYNAEEIAKGCRDIAAQENKIREYFREIRVWPVEMLYEDVVDDIDTAVKLMMNVMSVRQTKDVPVKPNPIKRVTTDLNLEWEERFRSEEKAELENLANWRPPLLGLGKEV